MSNPLESARQFLAGWKCEERAEPPPQGVSILREYKPFSRVEDYCKRYPLVYIAVETPVGVFVFGDVNWEEAKEACRPVTFICRRNDVKEAIKTLIQYAIETRNLTWIHFNKEALSIAGYCDQMPIICEPELMIKQIKKLADKTRQAQLEESSEVLQMKQAARAEIDEARRAAEVGNRSGRLAVEEILRVLERCLDKELLERVRLCLG